MDAENVKKKKTFYLFYMPISTNMCHKPIGCAAQSSRSECSTMLDLGAVHPVRSLRVKCLDDVLML